MSVITTLAAEQCLAARWHDEQTGRWTYLAGYKARRSRLLPGANAFGPWLLQYAYLKRIKKRDEESCRYCGSPVVDAEHTLFDCARWGVAREAVYRAVTAEFTPDTMVPLMLQSEGVWKHIESFITLVMRTKELDGRRERSNGEGQWKSHWGLHPRSCVPDRSGCRTGGESNYYALLAGAAPRFRWTNAQARGRVSGERMTEESFTT